MRNPKLAPVKKNLAVLQQFVLSDKPAWMKPIDRAVIEELLKDSDSKNLTTYKSVRTIAEAVHASYSTTMRSLNKMRVQSKGRPFNPKGVVVCESGKSQFDSNTWAVQISSLRLERQFSRVVISVDAGKIAERYLKLLKTLPKYTSRKNPERMCSAYRHHPTHKQRWELLAQDWLDDGFTMEQVNAVVDAGFMLYPDTARHGMHTLRGKFSRLCEEAGVKSGEAMPKHQINLPLETA